MLANILRVTLHFLWTKYSTPALILLFENHKCKPIILIITKVSNGYQTNQHKDLHSTKSTNIVVSVIHRESLDLHQFFYFRWFNISTVFNRDCLFNLETGISSFSNLETCLVIHNSFEHKTRLKLRRLIEFRIFVMLSEVI
jgi:hypothetical protein